jgi:hypothetical protein
MVEVVRLVSNRAEQAVLPNIALLFFFLNAANFAVVRGNGEEASLDKLLAMLVLLLRESERLLAQVNCFLTVCSCLLRDFFGEAKRNAVGA